MSKTLTFDSAPSFGPIYRRVLFGGSSKYQPGSPLPDIAAEWAGAQADAEKVKAYREAVGLPPGDTLPLLYPHVLTSGLHLSILSDPDFPFSLLGAVHARQHCIRHRPILISERVDAASRVADSRVVKAGIEFDVTTVLEVGGARVWEAISTYLVRGKKFGEPQEPPARAKLDDLPDGDEVGPWQVPANMGRRYAGITGDYNPIHIADITAKLFGFKQAIIHGMWSAARSLAELGKGEEDAPTRADLLFKGPVFIRYDVKLLAGADGPATRFDLYCGSNPRPVLQGQVGPAGTDTLAG